MCYESPLCAMRMIRLCTPVISMRTPTPGTRKLGLVLSRCVEIGTRFYNGRVQGAPVTHRSSNFPTLNATNIVPTAHGHGNIWRNRLGFDSSHGFSLSVFWGIWERMNAFLFVCMKSEVKVIIRLIRSSQLYFLFRS